MCRSRPAKLPRLEILLDLTDQRRVTGIARPGPHPDRDPRAGHRHTHHGSTGTISGGFIEQTCTEVVTVQTDGVHMIRGWSRGSRMGYDVSIVELGN